MKRFKALIIIHLFLGLAIELPAMSYKKPVVNFVQNNAWALGAAAVWAFANTEKGEALFKKGTLFNTGQKEVEITVSSILVTEAINFACSKSSFLPQSLRGHSARILACFGAYKILTSSWLSQFLKKCEEFKNDYITTSCNLKPFISGFKDGMKFSEKRRTWHLWLLYTATGMVPLQYKVSNLVLSKI